MTYEPGPLEFLDELAYLRVFHPDTPPPAAAPASDVALQLANMAAAVDVHYATILDNAEPDVAIESDDELDAIAGDALALQNGAVPGDDPDIINAMLELDGELDEAVSLLSSEKSREQPSPWIRPTGDDDFEKPSDDGVDGRYSY